MLLRLRINVLHENLNHDIPLGGKKEENGIKT